VSQVPATVTERKTRACRKNWLTEVEYPITPAPPEAESNVLNRANSAEERIPGTTRDGLLAALKERGLASRNGTSWTHAPLPCGRMIELTDQSAHREHLRGVVAVRNGNLRLKD